MVFIEFHAPVSSSKDISDYGEKDIKKNKNNRSYGDNLWNYRVLELCRVIITANNNTARRLRFNKNLCFLNYHSLGRPFFVRSLI